MVLMELLHLGGVEDLDVKDFNGDTPLMVLDRFMSACRKFERFSGLVEWEGHDAEDCRCKLIMLKAMKSQILDLEGCSEDDILARIKWGCTCGKCIQGWLSPSMLFRLEGE